MTRQMLDTRLDNDDEWTMMKSGMHRGKFVPFPSHGMTHAHCIPIRYCIIWGAILPFFNRMHHVLLPYGFMKIVKYKGGYHKDNNTSLVWITHNDTHTPAISYTIHFQFCIVNIFQVHSRKWPLLLAQNKWCDRTAVKAAIHKLDET